MSRFCLVAGEASGDQLGAGLIRSLKSADSTSRFAGIAGPAMQAVGCEAWWPAERLAHFGLFEVLREIPGLFRLRRELIQRIVDYRPDALVGIDAPDFNLGLEKRIKQAGIPTCHYVSPSVWAWRQHRVRKIAHSVDLMLCLFPFEAEFYRDAGVPCRFVGHPMADAIPPDPDRDAARESLGMNPASTGPVVALLPGSRRGEVRRHAPVLMQAASRLQADHPDIRFLMALASGDHRSEIMSSEDLDLKVHCNRARDVMAAADVVVLASGTATLEAMLVNRPLVVIYRLSPATYAFARAANLVKSRHISLPNILADDALVPELIQQQVSADNISVAVNDWLDQPASVAGLQARFSELRASLQGGGSDAAAAAVRSLAAGSHD